MSNIYKAAYNEPGVVYSVTGTNGVTALPTTGNVVVSGVNATTSTVGVASFNSTEFTVTSGGEVSLVNTIIFAWTDKAVSFNADAGNGYFITAGSVIATLPASPTQGQIVSFIVDTATSNALTVQANTGQYIRVGADKSAEAGMTVNNTIGDSLELIYRAADTTWISFTAPSGTWTTS